MEKYRKEKNLGKYALKGRKKEEHPFYEKKHTEESKKKMRDNHKDVSGKNNPMYGKERSIETKKKISKTKTGKHLSEETKEKISKTLSGKGNHFYGKKHTKESKNKISLGNKNKKRSEEFINNCKKLFKGENNPNWKGGKSFEPYNKFWNKELKRTIRTRDNFTCQLCFVKERKNQNFFDVHHIDYNKLNTDTNNLITLCKRCHSKTNSNREVWEVHLKNKMNIRSKL